jgi:rhomboid protease GluP
MCIFTGDSAMTICDTIGMDREPENIDGIDEQWLAIPAGLNDGDVPAILSERKADLWALVLASRNVPYRLESSDAGWQLLVPGVQYQAACAELRLYEEENRDWPPSAPPVHPMTENTLATLSVLLLLATFHNLIQLDAAWFGNSPVKWVESGNADAGAIMAGQLWRSVTALTLHSDWPHLLGNLAIGGVFIVSLCRDLGSGLAWTLLLWSGILGNLANAWLQPPYHHSIGASTLVFGAVGILAAVSLVRQRNRRRRRWPLPVAGALALLALLGTEGSRTDLGAHLFGLVFGLILGLGTEYLIGKYGRPGRGLNAVLALACFIVVVSAWWVALLSGR